jgi:8-oxo-dGTP pyrophosphatase MutT (NUDIX family)
MFWARPGGKRESDRAEPSCALAKSGRPRALCCDMGQSSAKVLRLSHLRRLRECEQVAAVCYRIKNRKIEFLLVRTGGGRWTFPKGGIGRGLTPAQAAALEAFEEAGVHGRMEEASFARYVGRKRSGSRQSSAEKSDVQAHLCQVLRLGPPQESQRDRTWFPAGKAKRRLRESRPSSEGSSLTRVVDRAVVRIRGSIRKSVAAASVPAPALPLPNRPEKDALQKVAFEASAAVQARMEATFVRYVRREVRQSGAVELAVNGFGRRVLSGGKVLQLSAPEPNGNLAAVKARQRLP